MDQDEEADNGGDGVLWIKMKRMIMVVMVCCGSR